MKDLSIDNFKMLNVEKIELVMLNTTDNYTKKNFHFLFHPIVFYCIHFINNNSNNLEKK